MAVSEIGLCSGHSASGVWVNERGETTVPGLYAAGDMASVPHGYMLGAFTYGKICARHAVEFIAPSSADAPRLDDGQIAAERERVLRPLARPEGIQPHLLEYKLRRHVNDYLQPPKSAHRLQRGLEYFLRAHEELEQLGAQNPHELMRATECGFIRDCAEMAARAAAILALRELRVPEAIPALTRAVEDAFPHVRREAVIALAHLRRGEVLPTLRQKLNDADPEVRKIAVGAVSFFQEPATNPDLLRTLFDEDWQVRRESAIALSRFPSEGTVVALTGALDDTHWQVTKEALLSLGKLRAGGSAPLAWFLSHEIADVRIAAATALGDCRVDTAVTELEALLNDPDTGVQKAARRALERLNDPPFDTPHS